MSNNRFNRIALLSRFLLLATLVYAQTAPITRYRLSVCWADALRALQYLKEEASMADMGLGYGSEFQLLRFLGRHRNEFDSIVKKAINTDAPIEWLDFKYDRESLTLDSELKGIEFLSEYEKFKDIKKEWTEYWTGNTQNWDAVFKCNGSYYIVEAKAHLKELESNFSGSENNNKKKIEKAFIQTANELEVSSIDTWFGRYYQLANRLAFIAFLNRQKIDAKLVYIYFINGYKKRVIVNGKTNEIEDKGVKTEKEWNVEIEKEYKELKIDKEKIKKHITNIFITCER